MKAKESLPPSRRVRPYLLAAAAVSIGLATRWYFRPALGDAFPFITYLPWVLLASGIGGWPTGITSVALSILAANFLSRPPDYRPLFGLEHSFRIAMFAFSALLVSWLRELVAGYRRRAEEAKASAEVHRTDFEKAQRNVELTRELLETTLRSIGDAVIVCDAEGRVTFVNAVAEQLTGYSAKDAKGMPLDQIFAICNEETRQKVDAPVIEAIRHGRVVGLANHTVLISRDGREIPIDDSAAPMHDPQGAVIGAVLIFRNISERREAERALGASEERLRLAVEAGEIGVWDTDLESGRTTWSEKVYELYGIQPGDFSGRSEDIRRYLHPEDAPRVVAEVRSVLVGDSAYNTRLRIIRPGGEVRWLEIRAHILRENGKPVRMIGASMDITDRQNAEIIQRENEARLQLALDVGRMGTWDWNLKSRAVAWSDGLFLLHGLAPGSVTPELPFWPETVHAQDLPKVQAELQDALDRNSDYRAEYRVVLPRQAAQWVEARGNIFADATGQPYRMIGVLIDVTERKRAEEALLRANEELQQFAYAASHDLQEPLRTVSIYAQLLARRHMPEATKESGEFVKGILEGTARMHALIDGLLALAYDGRMETLSRRTTSCIQVVVSTVSLLRGAVDESGAVIQCGALPDISGDAAQLTQVFQNLISNAIKYRNPEVPLQIGITATREGEFYRFAVEDNGLGFSPSHQEHIFGPFKRLHGPEIPGTGIGLSLCRRIIERHGGKIWAEGRPGKGATFYFTLPVPE